MKFLNWAAEHFLNCNSGSWSGNKKDTWQTLIHGRVQKLRDWRLIFQNYKIKKKIIKIWKLKFKFKTLPEAQRTQGIEFITWGNLSARIVQNQFQWHYLNCLQTWSPGGATCISSKFGHQMAPLALFQNLVTRKKATL